VTGGAVRQVQPPAGLHHAAPAVVRLVRDRGQRRYGRRRPRSSHDQGDGGHRRQPAERAEPLAQRHGCGTVGRMQAMVAAVTVLHAWLAIAATAAGAAILAASLLAVLGAPVTRRLLDRLLLVLLATAGLAALLGPVIWIGGRPPADPLHALYGAVAVLALPATRAVAGRRPVASTARWLLLGSLVTLGALLRLWMTGG
jgi:hypothetical protein